MSGFDPAFGFRKVEEHGGVLALGAAMALAGAMTIAARIAAAVFGWPVDDVTSYLFAFTVCGAILACIGVNDRKKRVAAKEAAEARRAESRELERREWARAAAGSLDADGRELLKMLVERGCVYAPADMVPHVMPRPYLSECREVGESNRDVVQLLPNGRARDVYEAANLAAYSDPGLMDHAAREGECMREPDSDVSWWWPCGDGAYSRWLDSMKAERDAREAARAEVEAGGGTVVPLPEGVLYGDVYDGGEQGGW